MSVCYLVRIVAMFVPYAFVICVIKNSVPVFTQHNGIASSLHGECPVLDTNKEDSLLVPGSNMFFFCWFCLISSINIPLRWKVAQVMQFAHASSLPASSQKEVEESGDDVDDDDI